MIAQTVKETIERDCPGTFSLYAGYGMVGGKYVRFPQGAQLREKRNRQGRVTLAEYRYADDSTLLYTYSTKTERYGLTAKPAKSADER